MGFDPSRIADGYKPTLEEIMDDIGIDSPDEFRAAVLDRCKEIYANAKKSENIFHKSAGEGNTYSMALCNSSDFYQTLVNMGSGNCALTVKDDYSSDVYFLVFTNKVPPEFIDVVASHEVAEYQALCDGIDQSLAHKTASLAEITRARELDIEDSYLEYLRESYPGKYAEMQDII
ncbi:hypothetical protein GOV11_04975 [Candidatus Woesearchaeota archaeon]|nr:hypothetical protein [Candidatus Woesearchaeota archaeon]